MKNLFFLKKMMKNDRVFHMNFSFLQKSNILNYIKSEQIKILQYIFLKKNRKSMHFPEICIWGGFREHEKILSSTPGHMCPCSQHLWETLNLWRRAIFYFKVVLCNTFCLFDESPDKYASRACQVETNQLIHRELFLDWSIQQSNSVNKHQLNHHEK